MTNVIYNARRAVPTGRNNHGEAFGLVHSDPAEEAPDLQILFIDGPGHIPDTGAAEDGTTLGPAEEPEQHAATPTQGYTIGSGLMRPRSRGTVRLATTEPDGPPVLDPNYFGEEDDFRAMIAGVRKAREIGRASTLDGWRAEEVAPGPDATSDADLREYIDQSLASYCHPVGTCRMGHNDMSVVGTDLAVHGITGLTVADASVLPSITAATPTRLSTPSPSALRNCCVPEPSVKAEREFVHLADAGVRDRHRRHGPQPPATDRTVLTCRI